MSLTDSISGAHSQACTDLQSLIICLNPGDVVTQNAVMQGYVGLRDALECIHRLCLHFTVSSTADLEAAEQYSWRLLLTVRSRQF